MYFTKENLQANSRARDHWAALWANREMYNVSAQALAKQYGHTMSANALQTNAPLTKDFWAEVDRAVLESRTRQAGMDIVDDLMSVQTTLPVGKTARLYTLGGEIADDVSISLDGQAPYSYDQAGYGSDGDPIPVFSAGYGVNWREAEGLGTVGIDAVLDAQRAKLQKYNAKIVNYFLNGDVNIKVQSYAGQGLKNHRNTAKIDLTVAGVNLTTATLAQLLAFFGSGAFGQAVTANQIDAYDVLWVSPQIWNNLSQANIVNGSVVGSVRDALMNFAGVREIRRSYALNGNEFLAYVRDRNVVTPLVGMTTAVTPLPRPLPNANFNFQILGAFGIQVLKDGSGTSGVVYGANLT